MYGTLGHSLQLNIPQGGAADSVYAHVYRRGQRGQLWASLTGRSRGLLALREACTGCAEAQGQGDIRTVAIDQIRGSESRSVDFDCDFNPLQKHTQDRWLSIARALERNRALPPVALIQAGDLYFVRDGHHRISAARAFGRKTIQAKVIVWQVAGSLTWGTRAKASGPGDGRWVQLLRRAATRLQEYASLSFRAVFGPPSPAFGGPVAREARGQ